MFNKKRKELGKISSKKELSEKAKEILDKLESKNELLKKKIIQLNYEFDEMQLKEILIYSLENINDSVLKGNIALFIGEMKIKNCCNALLYLLNNKNENLLTRVQTAWALGEIGDFRIANLLYDKFYRRKIDWDIEKYELLKAVIKIEGKKGRGFTKYNQLRRKNMLPKDQMDEIDRIILNKYKNESITKEDSILSNILEELIHSEPHIRSKGREKIKKLDEKEKLELISLLKVTLAESRNIDIQVDLIRALANINSDEVFDIIHEIVLNKEMHFKVRCKGIEKLELLDISKSPPYIYSIMADSNDNWQVRNCARHSLERISKRYNYKTPEEFYNFLNDEIKKEERIVMSAKKRPLIFISYIREDEKKVHILYNRLKLAGTKPWLDKEEILPGENWESRIQEAIRKSDFCILCLSRKSIEKKGYFQKEMKIALDLIEEQPYNTIWLIPIKLDICEIPNIKVGTQTLTNFQWVNFYEKDGFEKILSSIEKEMKK